MDRFDKLEGDLLFKGEILIITCESVGLYHENERMKMYDDGKLTLTNHRIIWKSSNGEPTLSLSLNLIEDFNLNSTLFHGSPKIDLKLRPKDSVAPSYLENIFSIYPFNIKEEERWKCEICFFEMNIFFQLKCQECGVSGKGVVKFWACIQCTYHNHISKPSCEMCSYPKSEVSPSSGIVKFSFRAKGSKSFYEKLTDAVKSREWEKREDLVKSKSTEGVVGGVNLILKKFDNENQMQNLKLNDAFSDLDSLMSSASEMVKMAESISMKISKDEQDSYKSLITNLGIENPVTKDVYRDKYFVNLSEQVKSFVSSLINSDKKFRILSLIDLYCLYNRARGSSLVSPEDLLKACNLFQGDQFRLKSYKSGVIALVSEHYDENEVAQRLVNVLLKASCLSVLEWSKCEGISVSIAEEQLFSLEEQGILCRDESLLGLHFFPNKFC